MPSARPKDRPSMPSRRIGYARVSTDEQNLALQLDALRAAGCDLVFSDEGISGAASNRPSLRRALRTLRKGDVLITWRLDRLGRSLGHLIDIMAGLDKRGVGFRSLCEAIDTTTAGGRLCFHVMGALAEFERSLIAERTRAGMEAARRRGVRLGRPPKLSMEMICLAANEIDHGASSMTEMATRLGVSAITLSRALERLRQAPTDPV